MRGVGWALALVALGFGSFAQGQGDVAATVNGEKIGRDEWQRRLETLRASDFANARNPTITAGQLALEVLVNQKLLVQYAAKVGLTPSAADIEADLQNLKKQPAIAQALERKAVTEEQLKHDALMQRVYYNIATTNLQVTPDEVKAFYDKHPELFGTPEQWKLAVIAVSSKAKADQVVAELAKGTAFATVAAQMSEDERTKANGGEQPMVPVARLPEYIRKAVSALKVGDTSGIVSAPNPNGAPTVFLVIRKLAAVDANIQPFEKVQAVAQRMALMEKATAEQIVDKKMADFRKSASIVVSLPGYEGMNAPTQP